MKGKLGYVSIVFVLGWGGMMVGPVQEAEASTPTCAVWTHTFTATPTPTGEWTPPSPTPTPTTTNTPTGEWTPLPTLTPTDTVRCYHTPTDTATPTVTPTCYEYLLCRGNTSKCPGCPEFTEGATCGGFRETVYWFGYDVNIDGCDPAQSGACNVYLGAVDCYDYYQCYDTQIDLEDHTCYPPCWPDVGPGNVCSVCETDIILRTGKTGVWKCSD
jgi:hypothetical protein